MQIKAVYARNNNRLNQAVFDCEPGIAPTEDKIVKMWYRIKTKATGQKVGLAEVSIRLIREKARGTKAGMRAKFGYFPPNQFNMDVCMDSIAVLNRIPKQDMDKTPYEMFSNNRPDYMRDFRVEWGEPVVDKKPKGISSKLKVTGQWAVVVRRIMNGTGVLKVYLIQTKRYAYHLHFTRAVAPEWVLENFERISLNDGTQIGFEEDLQPVDEALTVM
jgi:hypothetical protein